MSLQIHRLVVAVLVGTLGIVGLSAAKPGPMRQLRLDPEAEIVPLFEGLQAGQFQVRVSASGAFQAKVVIANTTDAPLTVAFPKAAVAVHVLPQFTGIGPTVGNGFGQNGFFGGNAASTGVGSGVLGAQIPFAQGGAQSIGGTFQGFGSAPINAPGTNFFGNSFPQIPPEMVSDELASYGGLATIPGGSSILLRMKTVCLNYGRPEPMPKMTYLLTAVPTYSSDPVLAELLESYTERVEQDVMQAAAWHIANDLSWEQLQRLAKNPLTGIGGRLFNKRHLELAQQLVASSTESAKSREEDSSTLVGVNADGRPKTVSPSDN